MPPAAAKIQPYGASDLRGFRNVLPPGTNGLVNPLDLGRYLTTGARPAHNNDQLAMYSGLTTAAPGIGASQLDRYFKDATFGVRSGDIASQISPEPGATIIRDQGYGVPHIYGDTRPELMFGIGYATAQDRLFFIDALRHAGRADLAAFAGGANAAMDASVWVGEPYTEADRTAQVNYIRQHAPNGQQIYEDTQSYVAGINAYIAQAKLIPLLMPAEYTALGSSAAHSPSAPRTWFRSPVWWVASSASGAGTS